MQILYDLTFASGLVKMAMIRGKSLLSLMLSLYFPCYEMPVLSPSLPKPDPNYLPS